MGVPSTFIRLAGCHLRCRWCDTAYAWSQEQGETKTLDSILHYIRQTNLHHVVITGGEPLIQDSVIKLTNLLRSEGCHITIETAAPRYLDLDCDLISISPKLNSSQSKFQPANWPLFDLEVVRLWIKDSYQLKFVASGPEDMPEILKVLSQIDYDPACTGLMPQARTDEEYRRTTPLVVRLCEEHQLRFWPRLHIELWNGQKGR